MSGPHLPDQALEITDLSHQGKGVARLEGKVIFVEGALPGEKVMPAALQHRGRVAETHVQQLIEASPDRVTPPCEYAGQCGGCNLQHLSYDAQVRARQTHLLNQFQRAGMTIGELYPAVASPPLGYRRRVRFLFDKKAGRLGFRAKSSNRMVAVDNCLILEPELQVILKELPTFLGRLGGQIREVELVRDNQVALLIRADSAPAKVVKEDLPPGVDCAFWQRGERATDLLTGEITTDVPGFLQANALINEALLQQAVDWLQPLQNSRAADFFCGAGNFSRALAAAGADVTGYELSATLVQAARARASERLTYRQCNLFEARALKQLKGEIAGFDSLLLDPPRAGAAELCQMLAKAKCPKILYVSCHPATLIRDAQVLTAGGYRLERLQMFDMFPQTMHAELMVLFVHRNKSTRAP